MKIAVLGKGMVGKTSLTYKLLNANYGDYDATIADKYKRIIDVDGKSIEMGNYI